MRHRKSGSKLNRTSSHRKAMFRNMVTSLFKYDRIRTTDVKAKELRGWAEHLITLAKRGDLHARRQAAAIIREKEVVYKLFKNAPERFANAEGGYTRIIKVGRRPGDAAPISLIELVTPGGKTATPKKSVKIETLKKDIDTKIDTSPPQKKESEAAKEISVDSAASSEKEEKADDGNE